METTKINFEEGAIVIGSAEATPEFTLGIDKGAVQLVSSKDPRVSVINSENFEIKFRQAKA